MCQNHICCYLLDNYIDINNFNNNNNNNLGGGEKVMERERDVKERVNGLLKVLKEVKKKLDEEMGELE